MSDSSQAFSGLRIIDFTQVLAGPFATQQLAQLGAEVIKIEQPGDGDLSRALLSTRENGMAPSYLTCNIGKRAITLDLKHPRAKEIVHRLVASADAVVENFRPGTMTKLGFDYATLQTIKPDLVYASISGYGQSGPKSPLAAFDGAIQAASGMMSISGHEATGPVRTGYFAVDMSTALNAAFAISAALLRRERTGAGQRVDISMLDTALVLQAPQLSTYLIEDEQPGLRGNESPTGQPTVNVFAAADGYVQIAALAEHQAEALLNAAGCGELYGRFPSANERLAHKAEIEAILHPAIAAKPKADWLALMQEAGVPCGAVKDFPEVLADEQLTYRAILHDTVNPDNASAPATVIAAGHMSEPAPPTTQGPAPTLGQDTDAVLGELGYSQTQLDELRNQGVI